MEVKLAMIIKNWYPLKALGSLPFPKLEAFVLLEVVGFVARIASERKSGHQLARL